MKRLLKLCMLMALLFTVQPLLANNRGGKAQDVLSAFDEINLQKCLADYQMLKANPDSANTSPIKRLVTQDDWTPEGYSPTMTIFFYVLLLFVCVFVMVRLIKVLVRNPFKRQ